MILRARNTTAARTNQLHCRVSIFVSLTIYGTPLERVSVYKLLGGFISADLRWETHIEYIISKAASRLYFLKQLKRAGLDILITLTPFLYYSDQTST